ncbi:MAG: hypothetical protein ACQEXB_10005 [Bacillota bacterium]
MRILIPQEIRKNIETEQPFQCPNLRGKEKYGNRKAVLMPILKGEGEVWERKGRFSAQTQGGRRSMGTERSFQCPNSREKEKYGNRKAVLVPKLKGEREVWEQKGCFSAQTQGGKRSMGSKRQF